MVVELDTHQLKAIEGTHNGSIIKGGVGTGKSRTALAYYYTKVCGGSLQINGEGTTGPMAKPRDIYVITTAKKRNDKDWEKEAASFAISPDRSSSYNAVQITVDSWNNIAQYEKVTDAFFIFDEQRLVGNGSWVKAFYKIAKANQWIMLSATPGDTWMEFIPIFVANGYYKNRTEFIHEHVIYKHYGGFPKVDRYIQTQKLENLRKKILVEMPYTRHTTRHVLQIMVEYDKTLFERVWKDRWHIYEERPIKDVSELFIVMRKLVNSDPSRLGAVMEKLEEHPRLIIFYNFNYELERLRTLGETLGLPMAEWNGHKHQPIPETDKWIYLVQYTAGAEGWNCIVTNAMLFYSLNYSYKINEQSKGRIDRMNTPYSDLWYYILRSSSLIDTAITKSVAQKKNFNERSLVSW